MVKVVGNLKGLIGAAAREYISVNTEDFRSNVPGPIGSDGPIGPQGVGVHHLKGTSTTQDEGDFAYPGETDTYTFYPDAAESYPLGWFNVRNGYDAFQYATTAGYAGTEADFYLELANVREYYEQSLVNANQLQVNTTQVALDAAQVALDAAEVALYADQVAADRVIVVDVKAIVLAAKDATVESANQSQVNADQVEIDAAQVAADRVIVVDTRALVIAARDLAVESADTVQEIFLGTKASDPMVDNQGNALVTGVMYFNSTTGTLRIWTGTVWSLGVFSDAGSVVSVNGRDGAVELTKADVGLGNVTNESKTTMFQDPVFTGIPKASTAGIGTSTTQLATTAFVVNEINKIEEW